MQSALTFAQAGAAVVFIALAALLFMARRWFGQRNA